MSAEIFTLASMQNAELEGEESEESGVSFTEGDHPDLSICDPSGRALFLHHIVADLQEFLCVFVQMSSPLSSCLISRLACVVVNWLTMSSAV